MAKAAHSFCVLDTQPRVWAALSDFRLWNRYLRMPDARKRGWGNAMAVRAGSGQGMQLAMLIDGQLVQDWVVEAWRPPEGMRLANRKCYGPPRAAMTASFEAAVAQVSSAETRVDLAFEASFCDPSWGWLLNLCPIKSQLKLALTRMERGLLDVLSGA